MGIVRKIPRRILSKTVGEWKNINRVRQKKSILPGWKEEKQYRAAQIHLTAFPSPPYPQLIQLYPKRWRNIQELRVMASSTMGCTHIKDTPCIRLAHLKFELTNQDSAGGKNLTVLTSM